jgi:hypothetical protein
LELENERRLIKTVVFKKRGKLSCDEKLRLGEKR